MSGTHTAKNHDAKNRPQKCGQYLIQINETFALMNLTDPQAGTA
jgi:hypothetical protein